jgi:hypothetical protein
VAGFPSLIAELLHSLSLAAPAIRYKDSHAKKQQDAERAYGSFTRSFSLPNAVSSEHIRADYRNGVLTLDMGKREESKPKQIKISVSATQVVCSYHVRGAGVAEGATLGNKPEPISGWPRSRNCSEQRPNTRSQGHG